MVKDLLTYWHLIKQTGRRRSNTAIYPVKSRFFTIWFWHYSKSDDLNSIDQTTRSYFGHSPRECAHYLLNLNSLVWLQDCGTTPCPCWFPSSIFRPGYFKSAHWSQRLLISWSASNPIYNHYSSPSCPRPLATWWPSKAPTSHSSVMDSLSSASPAQSASESPVIWRELEDGKRRPFPGEPLRYLRILYATSRCIVLGFCMNWLTTPTT